MTVELWALLGVFATLWASLLVQMVALDRIAGTKYALSNRDSSTSDQSATLGRLTRVVRNHVEGLALFGTLVVLASIVEVSNPWTRNAALVFVAARVLHFIFYAAGITHVRSIAWAVGFFGALPAFVYGLLVGLNAF
ncbi:MAG: MAPEG family protein [Myxococcota bacterium]